jgi:hypothetical protein
MNSSQKDGKIKSSQSSRSKKGRNFLGSISELLVQSDLETIANNSLKSRKSVKKGGNHEFNKYVDDFMDLIIEKESFMNSAKYGNYLSEVQKFYYNQLKNQENLSNENLKEIFKKIKERIDENNNKLKELVELPKFQKNPFTSNLLTNIKFSKIVKKPSVEKNISKNFINKLEKNEEKYGRFN